MHHVVQVQLLHGYKLLLLYYFIYFNLIQYKQNSHPPNDIYISKFSEIRNLYPKYIPVFTKQNNHTATAVVQKSHIITKRLPNSVSVYTAELYAILLALNELSRQHKHYLLFCDSTALLTKTRTPNYPQNLIKISQSFYSLIRGGAVAPALC